LGYDTTGYQMEWRKPGFLFGVTARMTDWSSVRSICTGADATTLAWHRKACLTYLAAGFANLRGNAGGYWPRN